MVEAAGAVLAWLGASVVLLADGRRGLAVGLLTAGAGVGLASVGIADPIASAALVAGAALAAGGRLLHGREGSGVMPPGSTPRLVLCAAGGVLALWVGVAIMSGAGPGLRFAAMTAIGLATARILASDDAAAALTAVALLALAVAAATGLDVRARDVAPYLVAAVVAAGSAWIPIGAARAA